MKYILSFILSICALSFVQAQNINFVNKSVCAPEYSDQGDINNQYVQGKGHNVYLSYPVEAQVGSFSDQTYEVGSEENPLVIYEVPDSLRDNYNINVAETEADENVYVFVERDSFVNGGIWEFRENPNLNRAQSEKLAEEARVWTCVRNDREEVK